MTISERIEAYLKAKGIRPADLARLTGINQPSLHDILKGKRPNPGLEVLESLIRNTDIDPHFLLSGDGEPIRQGVVAVDFSDGLPREARDAIQKAYQMVRDFLSVVPVDRRPEDPRKEGLFVTTVASLLVAGKQEEIPALMADLIRSYSAQPKHPSKK